MMLRKRFYIEIIISIAIYKCLNIREYHFLLVLHVIGDAMSIIIIEFEDESGEIIVLIESLDKLLANKRQLEIYIVGMGCP